MDTLGETDASIYSCKLTYTFNTTKIKYECYFQRVTSPAMHQKDNKALYPSRFNKRQRMLSDADFTVTSPFYSASEKPSRKRH